MKEPETLPSETNSPSQSSDPKASPPATESSLSRLSYEQMEENQQDLTLLLLAAILQYGTDGFLLVDIELVPDGPLKLRVANVPGTKNVVCSMEDKE